MMLLKEKNTLKTFDNVIVILQKEKLSLLQLNTLF